MCQLKNQIKKFIVITRQKSKAYRSSYNKDSSGKIERVYAFEC